ncbi:hypothetical protein J6590_032338 [Homalodisca vitripennis]|nr:hypothetical protein J6590_032338 [Homalodisca vitripennis]
MDDVEMSMECVIKIRKELKISERRGRRREGLSRKDRSQPFLRGGAGPTRYKRRRCNSESITPYSRGGIGLACARSRTATCRVSLLTVQHIRDMQVPLSAYRNSVSVWLLEVGAEHAESLLLSLSRLIA